MRFYEEVLNDGGIPAASRLSLERIIEATHRGIAPDEAEAMTETLDSMIEDMEARKQTAEDDLIGWLEDCRVSEIRANRLWGVLLDGEIHPHAADLAALEPDAGSSEAVKAIATAFARYEAARRHVCDLQDIARDVRRAEEEVTR